MPDIACDTGRHGRALLEQCDVCVSPFWTDSGPFGKQLLHIGLDICSIGLKPATDFERVACGAPFFMGTPKGRAQVRWIDQMKIKNSLKSLKGRHRANRLVRRKGRVYIINKVNPRFKARQG